MALPGLPLAARQIAEPDEVISRAAIMGGITVKKILISLMLVNLALFAFGCSLDDATQPDSEKDDLAISAADDAGKRGRDGLIPGEYYSMFFNAEFGYSDFSRIDRRTGEAELLWILDAPIDVGGGEENWWQG